jgi:DNA-binding response OmpR family regulator
MGIGLALVSDLVHLHDGHITVESEMNIGTTFTIRLPISVSHENVISSTVPSSFIEEKQSIQKDLEGGSTVSVNVTDIEGSVPKILLVDDHPEIRYYIRQILEEQYLVLEASHGIEATAILNMEDVDLIITDLMMPWMDGFELIESINANESWKKIPLLVVSARISGEDKEKVLYQGINDYLQKPFSKKELILRIDNLIKQKEKYADETKNVFDTLVKDNLISIEHNLKVKLEQVVKERINDPNLSVLSLSDAMAASERQVYRLVKKLTGLTPLEYITEVRVQFADYLIRQNKVKNASEAAKSVGIRNVTTFNKLYEKRFGQKPSSLFVD